ncbi:MULTISPECIES: hypothetical protein [Rhodococcus]|nr:MULTISPECIES: hypothetical protein [Rhodococcus]MDA3635148.1 hypothetical protein [Rhodococcus sp. C-2]
MVTRKIGLLMAERGIEVTYKPRLIVPGYRHIDFVEVIQNSSWPE